MSQVPFEIHNGDLPDGVSLGDRVAIDTEAMGLNWRRDRLCLVQLYGGEGKVHLVRFLNSSFSAPNLSAMIEDRKIQKIFHYARFDVGIMFTYLGAMTRNLYCTKIASRLTRTYARGHGLRALCNELLDVDLSKEAQSTDWGRDTLTDQQLSYAAHDVLHLHRLQDKLDEMLKREGRGDLHRACCEFLPTRVMLDSSGWENEDIFSHGVSS